MTAGSDRFPAALLRGRRLADLIEKPARDERMEPGEHEEQRTSKPWSARASARTGSSHSEERRQSHIAHRTKTRSRFEHRRYRVDRDRCRRHIAVDAAGD